MHYNAIFYMYSLYNTIIHVWQMACLQIPKQYLIISMTFIMVYTLKLSGMVSTNYTSFTG